MNLLDNFEIIRWCYEGVTKNSLKNTNNEEKLKIANKQEKKWGNTVIKTTDNNQWTTKLCENLVKEALIKLNRQNVKDAKKTKSSLREKAYQPDLECNKYVYEVKGRNWTTLGTAGEKMLGVPLKYGEIPRLFNKPLQIVLVAYQEYEAKNGYAFGDLLNEENQTKELYDSLAFYKEHHIEYVAFTDILKKINLDYGCWDDN